MEKLIDQICARIDADGPLPFSDFMEIALYDPGSGFFARSGRGPGTEDGSDFVTSPEISPLFGAMLARHAGQVWKSLGEPGRFDVVEAGAGRGALAEAFVDAAAGEPWFETLNYQLVDRAAVPVSGSKLPPPRSVTGLVVANELLDNIPGGLVIRTEDGWSELLVEFDGDRLAFVEGSLVHDPSLPPGAALGAVRVVAPQAGEWVAVAGVALKAGELLLIDYSDPPADAPLGGVRTFRGHGRGDDPLTSPGEQDITLPVDWVQVSRAAISAGLDVISVVTQAEWLEELGLGGELAEIRGAELAALRSGGTMEAVHHRDARMRASALLDPAGLGAFTVFRATRSA